MRRRLGFLTVLAATSGLAASAGAQTSALSMLDRLERGGWDLHYREAGAPRGKVCLGSGRDLIQLRHARLKCNPVVVEDTPGAVTVQYSCPGNGYGRTHIRRETDRLVQIDTQGIERGVPFAFAAEARWAGACGR